VWPPARPRWGGGGGAPPPPPPPHQSGPFEPSEPLIEGEQFTVFAEGLGENESIHDPRFVRVSRVGQCIANTRIGAESLAREQREQRVHRGNVRHLVMMAQGVVALADNERVDMDLGVEPLQLPARDLRLIAWLAREQAQYDGCVDGAAHSPAVSERPRTMLARAASIEWSSTLEAKPRS
jgi:hypothetical protein